MYDRFKGPNGKILLPLAFGGCDEQALTFAAYLAEETGMAVHLLHVCEPWNQAVATPMIYHGTGIPPEVFETIEEQARKDAEEKIRQVSQTFSGKGIICTHKVLTGVPAVRISAEANGVGASVILCSAKTDSYHFVPRGLSTALSLMSDSQVPVLVLPKGCKLPSGSAPAIAALDDLRDSGRSALGLAVELSMGFKGKPTLQHVHVTGQEKSELSELADKILESMTSMQQPYSPSFDRESFVREAEQNVKQEMDHRMGFLKPYMEQSGIHYTQHVLFGNVGQSLKDGIQTLKPDIVALGRHHPIHRRPFNIGKMPLFAMLNLERPVLMCPE